MSADPGPAIPGVRAQVRRYLADCAAVPWLDPKYHPTADGCLKFIPHGGSRRAAERIRAVFREESAPRAT